MEPPASPTSSTASAGVIAHPMVKDHANQDPDNEPNLQGGAVKVFEDSIFLASGMTQEDLQDTINACSADPDESSNLDEANGGW